MFDSTLNVQTFADKAIREIFLFSGHKLSRIIFRGEQILKYFVNFRGSAINWKL